MRIAYDRKMAELLADCCLRAYRQYDTGHVTPPPGYAVVAEFKGSFTPLNLLLARLNHWSLRWLRWILLPFIWLLDASGLFRESFGFALVSRKGDHYIISFRGTQNLDDWFTDADAFQTGLSRRLRGDAAILDKTRVHQGFQLLAVSLSRKVYQAAKGFKPKVPVYVTGHSLGGAVATLTALMLKARLKRSDVRMYSYAAPRVGDPSFASAYDILLPASYRVVNLADVVPVVPPREFKGWHYADLGKQWAFLNQSGDVVGNHGIDAKNNYIAACQKQVPSDKQRKYPITAV